MQSAPSLIPTTIPPSTAGELLNPSGSFDSSSSTDFAVLFGQFLAAQGITPIPMGPSDTVEGAGTGIGPLPPILTKDLTRPVPPKPLSEILPELPSPQALVDVGDRAPIEPTMTLAPTEKPLPDTANSSLREKNLGANEWLHEVTGILAKAVPLSPEDAGIDVAIPRGAAPVSILPSGEDDATTVSPIATTPLDVATIPVFADVVATPLPFDFLGEASVPTFAVVDPVGIPKSHYPVGGERLDQTAIARQNASVVIDPATKWTFPRPDSSIRQEVRTSESLDPQSVVDPVGRLQPYQGEPFTQPRMVPATSRNPVEFNPFANELAEDGLLLELPRAVTKNAWRDPDAEASFDLPGEEKLIRTLGRLLGAEPPVDPVGRGVSVLTPDELRTTNSTVADRNATALARNDQIEFVQRIVQAMQRARTEMPKTIEVELHPPNLGKLKLQVAEVDGELTAKIQAHSSATRALLVEHLPNLERQLGEHGVQIQRFQVDQMNTGTSAQADARDSQPGASGGEQSSTDRRRTWKAEGKDDELRAPLLMGELLTLADGMNRLV